MPLAAFGKCSRPYIEARVFGIDENGELKHSPNGKPLSIISKFLIDTGAQDLLFVHTDAIGFCEGKLEGNIARFIGGETNIRIFSQIGIEIPIIINNIPVKRDQDTNKLLLIPDWIGERGNYGIIGSGILELFGLTLEVDYKNKYISIKESDI